MARRNGRVKQCLAKSYLDETLVGMPMSGRVEKAVLNVSSHIVQVYIVSGKGSDASAAPPSVPWDNVHK